MASSLALKRLLSKPLPLPLRSAASNPLRHFSATTEQSRNTERPLSRKDEVQKAPVVVLFHASGLTCNQWRKLKNLWHPGKTLFRPIGGEKGKRSKFFEQVDQSVGPTSVLYLPKEVAAEKLALLPTEESAGQDILLLYGQYKNTLVDHIDITKVSEFDEAESSLFGFYLPSSYLSAVLDPPVFAADEGGDKASTASAAEALQS